MKRSISFSIRLPLELIDSLERDVQEKKFASVAEAIRSYIKLGILADSFKPKIKDPEFLKTIEELKQTDGIFRWIQTLSNEQIDAVAYAFQMEKEERFEQRNLR